MAKDSATISGLMRHPLAVSLFDFARAQSLDIRLVGGAVRDALAGWQTPSVKKGDLDFAVNIPIERFIQLAETAKFKVFPTGLSHGTVTLVIGDHKAEITQLRYDLDTDGRHADTRFTDDWQRDAQRRDFTINAIYLNSEGELFDPCGGIADLSARQLRFIGDATQRLEEDYLRLLRGIRLLSEYPELHMSPTALEVMKSQTQKLVHLSAERKTAELSRIFAGAAVSRALHLMNRLGVDRAILGAPIAAKFLANDKSPLADSQLAGWFSTAELADQLVLVASDRKVLVQAIGSHLRLSRSQQKALLSNIRLLSGKEDVLFARLALDGDDWQKSCFRLEKQAALAYWQGCVSGIYRWQESRMRQIVFFARPTCPISGQDVIVRYNVSGREVGDILDRLTQRWIDSGFSLTKAELLS